MYKGFKNVGFHPRGTKMFVTDRRGHKVTHYPHSNLPKRNPFFQADFIQKKQNVPSKRKLGT